MCVCMPGGGRHHSHLSRVMAVATADSAGQISWGLVRRRNSEPGGGSRVTQQLDEQEWVWKGESFHERSRSWRHPHCFPHTLIFPWELDKEKAGSWFCAMESVRKKEQRNTQTYTKRPCPCQILVCPLRLLVFSTILCGRLLFYFRNKTET